MGTILWWRLVVWAMPHAFIDGIGACSGARRLAMRHGITHAVQIDRAQCERGSGCLACQRAVRTGGARRALHALRVVNAARVAQRGAR